MRPIFKVVALSGAFVRNSSAINHQLRRIRQHPFPHPVLLYYAITTIFLSFCEQIPHELLSYGTAVQLLRSYPSAMVKDEFVLPLSASNIARTRCKTTAQYARRLSNFSEVSLCVGNAQRSSTIQPQQQRTPDRSCMSEPNSADDSDTRQGIYSTE